MGMFDYVDYECDCPICGKKMTELQTKDGRNVLEIVSPWLVNDFGGYCKKCKCSVDFIRSPEKTPTDILNEAINLVLTMIPFIPENHNNLARKAQEFVNDARGDTIHSVYERKVTKYRD